MKKVSIISPIYANINRIGQTVNGLLELFKDRYDFEVLYYHSVDLPEETPVDNHFLFYKIEKGQSYNDCITDAFAKVNGNCVIVANLDDVNYKEYITKLLVEWENKAQIVLLKKEEKKRNIFQKIGHMFVRCFQKLSDFVLGMFNLSKDFRAMRTWQLFSDNVVEVIKEFPEKNYYLRNFDCWVDFRVSVLRTSSKVKVKQHEKKLNKNFAFSAISTVMFLGLLFAVIFTAGLIDESKRSMYVLIGIGLMVVFAVFGFVEFLKWYVYKKTRIKKEYKPKNAEVKE